MVSLSGKVRPDGFEPPTTAFEAQCSIQLSYGRAEKDLYLVHSLVTLHTWYRDPSNV
jgi:hypothetical protein